MEKEILENENIENIDDKVAAAQAEAEQNTKETTAEVEWSAIKKPKRESEESDVEKEEEAQAAEEAVTVEEMPEPEIESLPEPEVKVAAVEEIEPIEEYSTDTTTMAKLAKKERKAMRREVKEAEVDYEDDGSVLKTKSFRKLWNSICFVLLIVSIGLPIGLLIYIIMHYFL